MVRRVQERRHFFEPLQLHNARAARYARGRGVSLQRMRQRLNSLYINRAVLAQFARKPRKSLDSPNKLGHLRGRVGAVGNQTQARVPDL